jgi:2-C-methyl-D-erythritol 4-phosphate cytidylyltransferase
MKVPKNGHRSAHMSDVAAILVAGGSSVRFGDGSSVSRKQFELIGGMPMYQYVARTFGRVDSIHTIVLVGPASDVVEMERGMQSLNLPKKWKVVAGGTTRQESAENGLNAITDEQDITIGIVHDVARALVEETTIRAVIEAIREHGAAAACIEVVDTIKRGEKDEIVETIPREGLWRAQTPQGARIPLLRRAYQAARSAEIVAIATDEAQLLERIGVYLRIVRGSERNFKITYPDDLERARGVEGAR